MVKRVFEVWTDENGVTMFMRGSKGWKELLSPDSTLLRTFAAESRFEAFRTHYRLMGFGEWEPPEGVSDMFFTGEDQHDFG